MKGKYIKITSVILSAAVLLGGVGYAAAARGEKPESEESRLFSQRTSDKEETVYVIADADGNTEKVIVSEWLKNPDGAESLEDVSTLGDIMNVRGDETYTGSGSDITWAASGSDIYYQGRSDKALPVGVNVSYYLDNSQVTADELMGKSGHITVRFDYVNNEKRSQDGRTYYVPFALVTGLVLDNDSYKNISLVNGSLTNDGDRSIAVGVGFPGLGESLGLEEGKLPTYFEMSADVTDFDGITSMTVATNELFSQLNLDDVSSVSDLSDSLSELNDGALALVDGTKELYDGLSTLLTKSGELTEGIDTLYTGAKELNGGIANLKSGADTLSGGLSELDAGLSGLSSNSESLRSGAAQIAGSILASADSQLKAAGLELPALTMENYAAVLDGAIAAVGASGMDEAQAAAMTASLNGLRTQLDGIAAFYSGVATYTAGVDSAAAGSAELKAGAEQLSGGAAQLQSGSKALYGGIGTLKEGSTALVDGVTELCDGSKALRDGMQKFYDDGIKKLVDALDGELGDILDNLKTECDISRSYQSYGGISPDTEGATRFIIRIG